MNKVRNFPAIMIILITMLLLMAVHYFVYPFPDWAVRTVGIVMLADLAWFGYSLGCRRLEQKYPEEGKDTKRGV